MVFCNKHIYVLILLSVLFCSCKKDQVLQEIQEVEISAGSGVLILNEGNFQWGNSGISYYNFAGGEIIYDVFYAANNRPLGDVAQSMQLCNGKLFIVVNNSGKVEVVNPSDFKSEGTITGLTSPRYFLCIDNDKAYVSDFASNSISVINLSNYLKIASISCPGSTEEMLMSDGKVYVTNTRKPYIYVIDPQLDKLTDSIPAKYGTNSMVFDKNGKLWVISMGDYNPEQYAFLQKINPANKTTELCLSFNKPLNVWDKLRINKNLDTLYYNNNGVFRMPVSADELPQSVFIEQDGKLFYGLGIDPNNGNIYVSDAVDYVQKGNVFVYSAGNGSLIQSFKAGIIPSSFLFL